MPSLIPWQGLFHISLNIQKTTALLFRPFFEKLYVVLFGNTKKMPKRQFQQHLDHWPAYGENTFWWGLQRPTLYTTTTPARWCCTTDLLLLCCGLQGGRVFQHWFSIMSRVPLYHISDIIYHQGNKPHFGHLVLSYLNTLTEKKVEVFHSKLRRFTNAHSFKIILLRETWKCCTLFKQVWQNKIQKLQWNLF